jgi:hypothetical protein
MIATAVIRNTSQIFSGIERLVPGTAKKIEARLATIRQTSESL